MTSNSKVPCKDCITFPICRNKAFFILNDPYNQRKLKRLNEHKLCERCEIFSKWWVKNMSRSVREEINTLFKYDKLGGRIVNE